MADDTKSTAESIAQKIARAIENVMTLRVTTVIGPVTVSKAADDDVRTAIAISDNAVVECATTSLNLLDGDITQIRTEKFVSDPAYAKMHDDALVAARAVVTDNLAAVKAAFLGLEKFLPRS